MRDEGRLRALTGLSELWDGSPLKRTRAGDGSIHLPGRRLALHLMVQPGIAPLLLGDKLANGQGFLSRLLVSFPASTQGQRLQREPNPSSRPALQDYCDVIQHLLATQPRLIGNNELDPPKLRLTPAAAVEWRAYADKVERGLAGDRLPGGVRGLHNKAAELVLRVAGVLTLADEPMAQEISPEVLRRAIVLTTYYLSEAARLYEAASVTEETGNAMKLLQWLVSRPEDDISVRDIVTFGPACLRETAAVEQSLSILVKHGWCRIETAKPLGRDKRIVRLSPYARSAF